MQNLVSALEDRNLDFLDRVTKANEILEDRVYLYPVKVQMLFDWLSASLLKIGKFDDTAKSSKVHVFSGASVWDLFLRILRQPFLGNPSLLSEPQIVDRRLLKLHSPILAILGQFFRTASKMDAAVFGSNFKRIHLILKICNEHYFDQLGQNPVHFCNLLESVLEALNQNCPLEMMQGSVLESVKICFAFIQQQSNKKKAITLFYERFFPLMGQLFQFYRDIPSFETSVEATFKGFLFDSESLADLSSVLNTFHAYNRASLLKGWSSVSAGVETSSGFYPQLPEQILGHGQYDALLAFLFRLIVEKSSSQENADRSFAFNLLTVVIVALSRQPVISFSSLSVVLKTLLNSNMYQHRNDDIYKFQTDFLRYLLMQIILPSLSSQTDAWSVLSVLTELNFYLVSEQFGTIAGKTDGCDARRIQAFLICFLGFSISARQLGAFLPELVKMKILDFLVDANGNPPYDLTLLLKKLSSPLVLEVVNSLLGIVKEQFSPNAYFLASLFLQYSNFPNHFLTLVNCCLDMKHHTSADASIERFLLCFFNRTSVVEPERFGGISTQFASVDALLAHRLGAPIPVEKMQAPDLIRFIPILREGLQERSEDLLNLIVGAYVLIGSFRYTPLLRNANFYESQLVKHNLVPYLVSHFPGLSVQPDRLMRFICALPGELFSGEHSQRLFDEVAALNDVDGDLKVRAIVTISSNPSITVPAALVASLHSLLSAEDPKLAGRLVSASIRQFGVCALLKSYSLTRSHRFVDFAYLKPLILQSNPETVEDAVVLKSFCQFLMSSPVDFNAEPEALDLIDAIIMVASQFNFQDILESLFSLMVGSLKVYQDENQLVPGNLLVCLAKTIRSKNGLLPACQYERLLALCSSQDLKCPSDAYEKAIIILLESMPFELFQDILKGFAETLSGSSTDLKERIVGYVSRLLNSSDKGRAKLCFELGCWALKRDIKIGSKLALSHKLVISKSLKPINASELSCILEVCFEHLAIETAFEEVCGILLVLQQSYWPLLKTMMPVYIALFQRILEQQATQNNLGNAQLFVRVLADSGTHTGLSFHLTPLLLQYVCLVANGTLTGETLKIIEKAVLPLLKHLESSSNFSKKDDPTKINAIDNFGRLLLVCQQSDQKTVVKRMVEDYRKEYKYTGKA